MKIKIWYLVLGLVLSVSWRGMAQTEIRPKNNQEGLNFDECVALETKIRKFQNKSTLKPFKAVVGLPITYKAKKVRDATNWRWRLGTLDGTTGEPFWALSPAPQSDRGETQIPLVELSQDNSDFGTAHGQLEVNVDSEGNPIEPATEEVEVYFQKDDEMNGVPNWFKYWKQIDLIKNKLAIPGIKLFNEQTCSLENDATPVFLTLEFNNAPYDPTPGVEHTYGENRFNVRSMETKKPSQFCQNTPYTDRVVTAYSERFNVVKIGRGCGFKKQSRANPNINLTGIHVFYATLVHEVEHALIDCRFWKNGYDSSLDTDGDSYPDEWEIDNMDLGFRPNQPDDYGAYTSGDLEDENSGITAGTRYEEKICRNEEAKLINSGQINKIDMFDWSFSNDEAYQGKQWNE